MQLDEKDMERLLVEKEARTLNRMIDEVIEPYPPAQASRLREVLLESAQLRRYEHGGSYVTVKMGEEYVPLDRAVAALAERNR